MKAQVAVVSLIDYRVGDVFHLRTFVVFPALRIGGCHIYYSGAIAVHANRFRPYAGSLVEPAPLVFYAEGVEAAVELTRHRGCPCTVVGMEMHVEGVEGSAVGPVGIEKHLGCLGLRAPQTPVGARGIHHQLQVLAAVGGIVYELLVIVALGRNMTHRAYKHCCAHGKY